MALQIVVKGFSSVFLCNNWICHHDIMTSGNQDTPPGHSSSYFHFLLHLAGCMKTGRGQRTRQSTLREQLLRLLIVSLQLIETICQHYNIHSL